MPRRKATPEKVEVFLASQEFRSTDIEPSARSAGMRGPSRIMYIELKSGNGYNDRGPARIGRITFSKTGKTLYYRGHKLQSLKGSGLCANYFDVKSGDEYWVSGCKKNGQDRHWAGAGPVKIDDDVRQEYWAEIRQQPERADQALT